MKIGVELARAREARGLSLDEFAARLNISVATVAAVENGDVGRLPPPMLLRVVLRTYADELGLDADSLIRRYVTEIEEVSLSEFDSEDAGQDAAAATLARSGEPIQAEPERRSTPKTRSRRFESVAAALVGVITGFTLASIHLDFFSSNSPVADERPAPARPDADEPDTAAEQPDVAAIPKRPLSGPPVDELSGSWTMMNEVEATDYRHFKDLTLEYRLQLEQDGNRVSGQGQKWTENGRLIASRGRTPITVSGTLEGRRLELAFIEQGLRRASRGTLVMQLADDGSMHGKFSSDAARSSGSSQARRIVSRNFGN